MASCQAGASDCISAMSQKVLQPVGTWAVTIRNLRTQEAGDINAAHPWETSAAAPLGQQRLQVELELAQQQQHQQHELPTSGVEPAVQTVAHEAGSAGQGEVAQVPSTKRLLAVGVQLATGGPPGAGQSHLGHCLFACAIITARLPLAVLDELLLWTQVASVRNVTFHSLHMNHCCSCAVVAMQLLLLLINHDIGQPTARVVVLGVACGVVKCSIWWCPSPFVK